MTQRIVSLAIGYLCGMVLFAHFAGRLTHKDLSQEGSGNLGMANTIRVLGRKWGAMVLAGDILKVIVAVAVCQLLYHEAILTLYAGLGAALGHCYPAWHHFTGGKAVACLSAAYVLYAPLWGIVSLAVGGLAVLLKMGLKWGAVLISLTFACAMGLTGSQEAFWLSLVMAALMILRNAPRNKLDKK